MRNLFIILIALCCFTSCTQNSVEISDQYVYDGRGGIKCEVDGVLLKPSTAILYGNATLRFDSDLNNITYMTISFHNNNTSTGLGYQSVTVRIMDVNPNTDLTGSVYSLKNEINNESFGNYIRNDFENKFQTNDIVNGELKVLYHNLQGRMIVGGTFWFDAINNEGVIVKVRNGQFDLTM